MLNYPFPLTWTRSANADEDNDDQETGLSAIGSPGGASWASVSPDGRPGHRPWTWVIYNRWNDVDEYPDSKLASGGTETQDEAKAAVTAWIRQALEDEGNRA